MYADAPGAAYDREDGQLKLDRILRYIPARAYDNTCYYAYCNQCGLGPARFEGHAEAGGGATFDGSGISLFCDPAGEVISQVDQFEEPSLIVCELKAAVLEAMRGNSIGFFRSWQIADRERRWAAEAAKL